LKDNRWVNTNHRGDNPNDNAAQTASVSAALLARLRETISAAGGWLPFDRFMAMALYEPGLGYYANGLAKFGHWPGADGQGSDFVTAPELTPRFGHTLSRQVAQALAATHTDEVWEFGAGSGALAAQVLHGLEVQSALPRRYTIVDLSGSLRERQREALARWGDRVQWADQLPDRMAGVVLGNEVLDAMPVQLLHRRSGVWHERGVALDTHSALTWEDRPTALRPALDDGAEHDYLTEIHPQAEAFVRTLADRWERGAAFFIDYGFPEAEYYHPQRHMGTLSCFRAHRHDERPLEDVGLKDITAHVNFTGVALAAQDAGLSVLGYTSQGRFLLNCGVLDPLSPVDETQALRDNSFIHKLVMEHEMGELFKVLVLAPQASAEGWLPLGLSSGDRSHRL
jgi:SAM-dependent MidA family methyltransferase